ncbi:MAG: hypothetical protein KDI06_09765 [Calditrichaeota bacterium]|nr:hypothetical protein [Calditrichota bacterium]
MKPIFCLLLLGLTVACRRDPNSIGAKPIPNYGWSLRSDLQDNIQYYAVHFADKKTGWLVGSSGTIKSSTDGGETWVSQTSGVQSTLWEIQFTNGRNGWSCGHDNSFLRTTDGGENWDKIEVPNASPGIFVGMAFADANNGWLSNNQGELLKTTDGGLNWQIAKRDNPYGARLSIFDENTVYAFSGKLYRTYDGGATWDSLEVPFLHDYSFWVMSFPDPDHGFLPTINGTGGTILTEYPVLITRDGGNSWFSSDSLRDGNLGFTAMFFSDDQNGWVAGNGIYGTQDGGASWEMQYSGIIAPRDMDFIDQTLGWLLTRDGRVYQYGEQ